MDVHREHVYISQKGENKELFILFRFWAFLSHGIFDTTDPRHISMQRITNDDDDELYLNMVSIHKQCFNQ